MGLEFGFVLAKQVLHHLSHALSPFCSGYFGDGGLTNYLTGLVLNHDPPDLRSLLLVSGWHVFSLRTYLQRTRVTSETFKLVQCVQCFGKRREKYLISSPMSPLQQVTLLTLYDIQHRNITCEGENTVPFPFPIGCTSIF
jgi:hypothetical protein